MAAVELIAEVERLCPELFELLQRTDANRRKLPQSTKPVMAWVVMSIKLIKLIDLGHYPYWQRHEESAQPYQNNHY